MTRVVLVTLLAAVAPVQLQVKTERDGGVTVFCRESHQLTPEHYRNKQITATMHACNRHPRMGDMYRRYYDEWAKIGGEIPRHVHQPARRQGVSSRHTA